MENRGRVLSVDFSNAVGRTVKASPLTAIDYGQILEIHGLPLPPSFECHFSKNGATAYKSIGTTTDGVGSVPFIDEQTQSGGIITAYIYLHETADDGETEYRIIIPVESRPGVTPAEPTPVEQDVIAQAISALNNAVTVTTANVEITEANKQATQQSAEEAEADANRADLAWNGAVIAQNSAQASADTASQKATEASQSASTAHSEAQYAKSYSESAHTDAQSAGQSATSAQNSATSAQQSASHAQQYASTATAKASEAMQSAQSASQSAQMASQSATDAQNSATQANTKAQEAHVSATSATASEANAMQSAISAEASAESAQASADRAEQEADRWYEFLPVDTASGSLAHITDGADDVPVKALSVDLEPVQDLHGQDSPYPAGGGKNKFPVKTVSLGNPNSRTVSIDFETPLPAGQYTVSFVKSGTVSSGWGMVLYNGSTSVGGISINTGRITTSDSATRAYVYIGQTAYDNNDTLVLDNIQLEAGSTATEYAPYSNICPITGHTQAVVNRTDGNGGNLQSITIPLGDTVYGGTLDVTNGVLTVDRAMVDLGTKSWSKVANNNYANFSCRNYFTDAVYNAYVPTFICSIYKSGANNTVSPTEDNYAWLNPQKVLRIKDLSKDSLTAEEFTTAMSGVQLCYELANPITVPLTANQMTTLLGINNVWSDSGDVSVDYRADIQLYIQKMIANVLNA